MEITILFTHSVIVPMPLVLPHREVGASVEFLGLVRELENGEALGGLFYEAHESMATRHLQRIFTELSTPYPCAGVDFIHRLGWVPVGEASLFIRVLSRHRGPALHFCADAIDRMKADVPIWKIVRPATDGLDQLTPA